MQHREGIENYQNQKPIYDTNFGKGSKVGNSEHIQIR